jgi:hypothetical protein
MFTKIETSVIVTEGEVHNSSWADYDNDGDVDLFMGPTNGAPHRLYRNNGDGTFTKVVEGPIVGDGGSSSAVWNDYDRDGDLDLFVARNGNNLLYRNEGNDNHWINIELIGAARHGMVPGTAVVQNAGP